MSNNIIQINKGISKSYIINGKNKILVDTSININKDKFIKIFKDLNIEPKEIKLIAITHAHTDHFNNLYQVKELTGAKVLCHPKAVEPLKQGKSSKINLITPFGKFLMKMIKDKLPIYQPVNPDIVTENFNLSEYGIAGEVISTPGHSDCSLSILLNSGEAIIGDMLFSSFINTTKPAIPSLIFKTDKTLINSIKMLLDKGIHTFYGGHGGPYKREDVIKLIEKKEQKLK